MTVRFMSRQDIADYLGVKLATVKGYASFPAPDVIVGRNQGWAQATVDEWLRRQVGSGRDRKASRPDQRQST